MPAPTPQAQRERIFDEVCSAVANAEHVGQVCADNGIDRTAVWKWIKGNEEWWQQYARAKEYGADSCADDIVLAARRCMDGTLDPNAARVAIDAMKWTASKLKPSTYGDRVEARLSADSGFVDALKAIESMRTKAQPCAPMIDVTPDSDTDTST